MSGFGHFGVRLLTSMNASKKPLALCRLCGQVRPVSFEHIPPQSAFNRKPVFIQRTEHLFDPSSHLFGKRKRLAQGMGKDSLCETCNKQTGDWYARDYGAFAQHAHRLIEKCTNGYTGEHLFRIRPLRVLKQALTMFASAESTDLLLRRPGFKEYLLNPLSMDYPTGLNLHFYYCVSRNFRLNGWVTFLPFGSDTPISCSEIAFRPFGFVLSFDGIKPHPKMVDITFFKDYAPDETSDVVLDPPVLGLAGVDTGLYSYALSKTGSPL